jgi:hypothetical protein
MVDFSNLTGREIPGGCAECSAYQTMRQELPGVWVLVVHHDDDCRFYMERASRRGTR